MEAIVEFLGRTRVDLPVTLFRLLLSFVLGGLIGIEREWHNQSAGLRTHIVISVGSTLLTLLSIYIPQTFTHFQMGDPGRIAAQIVSGIGFLGGGAIFRLGANVRGLTTAASIWAAAGIGMAVGAGMYAGGVITVGIVIFVLFALASVEKRFFPDVNLRIMEIGLSGLDASTEEIFPILKDCGIRVRTVDISKSFEENSVRLKLTVQVPANLDWKVFYGRIGSVKEIARVTLDQKI
jgi:putative Mg2+ transporter-C (MgtC) family protein